MRQLKIIKQVTNRESKSLDKYLQDISKIDLITAQEEVELAQKIRAGDQAALEKLTNANLRFVVSVAKQYQNQGLKLPDLINEGNVGLVKAAKRFDETRGFKFISYAVWWIRQSILQALAEQSRVVRLPLNRVGTIKKITKEAERQEKQNERSPRQDEIAEGLDMDDSDVANSIKMSRRHHSLDMPFQEGESNSLSDVIKNPKAPSPDEGLMSESLKQDIENALGSLKEKERTVLKMYFGIGCEYPKTLNEIGEEFDLTRERIRQIKDKAIRRLRHKTRSEKLRRYLG